MALMSTESRSMVGVTTAVWYSTHPAITADVVRLDERQLLLQVGANYFCRSAAVLTVRARLRPGVPGRFLGSRSPNGHGRAGQVAEEENGRGKNDHVGRSGRRDEREERVHLETGRAAEQHEDSAPMAHAPRPVRPDLGDRGRAASRMRAHKENLEAAHRVPPSRTTLERIAIRLGAAAVDGATKIEPVVRRAERVPEGTVAVSIGLDRTSVPRMEDRPADAPPKPERKRLRPRQRRAPRPLDVPLPTGDGR